MSNGAPPTSVDTANLIMELARDIADAGRRVEQSDTPSSRRDFVRAFLAVVEGLTFAFKQRVLQTAHLHDVVFEPDERSLLCDEQYGLDDNGTVQARPKHLRTAANVRFMVLAVSKVNGRSYQLDVRSQGWQAFQQTVGLRDRLMHPKVVGDIVVSDAELTTARTAAYFMLNVFTELSRATTASMEALRESLRQLARKE